MSPANRKLNIGCGEFKKEGFLNIDIDPALEPDIVHDLNQLPYPFETGQFQLIEADHVLEHLENPLRVMTELHRILEPGGRLVIRVPHFSRGFVHPDHKRGFDTSLPSYFDPKFKGGYTGVEFRLERLRLVWFSQPYLKRLHFSPPVYYTSLAFGRLVEFFADLSPRVCSRVWCFWVGGFEEIELYFRCQK